MKEITSSDIFNLLGVDSGPSFGEFLEANRDSLGISQRQLCKALGIQWKTYNRIVEGEAQKIDLLTILSIAQFLNLDSKKLIEVFVAGSSTEEIAQLSSARRAGFILKYFDLEKLRRIGFISTITDFDYIESKIKSFFHLDTIYEYARPVNAPLFMRSANPASDKMLYFWLQSLQYQFRKIENPYEYDREHLKQILPKLRALSADEKNGFRRAIRELYRAGITVLFEKYLGNTQIYGGTFFIKDKPCVVVTDYNKRYPNIWHGLIHELYHVLKDEKLIKREGYHLSAEDPPTLFTSQATEDLANAFAAELLLPTEMLRHCKDYISMPGIIESRAKEWGVHTKIIYGRYMHVYGVDDDWKKYGKLITLENETVRQLLIDPTNFDDLDSSVEQAKQILNINQDLS